MSDLRDFTGKNRKFTGTNSIRLPNGTTAQRIGSLAGEIRFNSTIGLAEYYTGSEWKAIDSPPTLTGVSVDGRSATNTANSQYVNVDAGGNVNIVITGTGASGEILDVSPCIYLSSITSPTTRTLVLLNSGTLNVILK